MTSTVRLKAGVLLGTVVSEDSTRLPAWLPAVVLAAASLRVLSALYQGDSVQVLPGVYDQISYDALAQRVLAGYGFTFPVDWWPVTRAGEPTAHWSFLYTLYLTAVYGLLGVHPLAARLIQAVVAGLLHPWLGWRIGHRMFGNRVGFGVAVISAVYPYFVYYAGALMTETFYILAILWALDLSIGIVQSSGPANASLRPNDMSNARDGSIGRALRPWWPWFLLGFALGTAALMRQVILLLLPLLIGWFLWTFGWLGRSGGVGWRLRFPRSVIVGLVITVVVLCLMIAPWSFRNYRAFGRFVLLNSNAGYAFFWANHPIHGSNFISILPSDAYIRLIPSQLRMLDEASLDQALLREGIGFVTAEPGRYVLLSLSRVRDYFQFWPSSESSTASNMGRVLSFGLLLPFAVHGIYLSVRLWRRRALQGQEPLVVLLWLFVSSYSLIHLLSWALIRYRLPVDAVLMPFAALSLQVVWEWLRRRSTRGDFRGARFLGRELKG